MKNKVIHTYGVLSILLMLTGGASAADFPENREIELTQTDAVSGVKVGVLKCAKKPGFGYVIGSAKNLDCVFTNHNDGSRSELYTGQIVKVGPDIGYTDEGVLVWGIYAPTGDVANQKLDGTYVGLQAEATLLVGGGINMLSGSFNNSYNLVPLSVSGGTGLNVAGGLGAITLASVE